MKKQKKENISIQLNGKQVTLLTSGIFLISVLSFLLGAFLVQGFKIENTDLVPNQTTALKKPRKNLIDLKNTSTPKNKPQKIKKDLEDTPKILTQKKVEPFKKEKLTFFDTLADKNKNTKQKTVASAATKATKAAQVASVKKINPQKLKAKFTIQIVSYKNKKYADSLTEKLKTKGFDAYITEVDLPEKGKFFRVRVGSYENKNDAVLISEKLFQNEGKTLKFGRPVVVSKK